MEVSSRTFKLRMIGSSMISSQHDTESLGQMNSANWGIWSRFRTQMHLNKIPVGSKSWNSYANSRRAIAAVQSPLLIASSKRSDLRTAVVIRKTPSRWQFRMRKQYSSRTRTKRFVATTNCRPRTRSCKRKTTSSKVSSSTESSNQRLMAQRIRLRNFVTVSISRVSLTSTARFLRTP